MNRYKYIIESIEEPDTQNLWLSNGKLQVFGPKGWASIAGGDEASEGISNLEGKVSNLSSQVSSLSRSVEDINSTYATQSWVSSQKYLTSVPAEYVTETKLLAKGYTTNTGTITGIKMNGDSKGTSGVVDLGTVLTSHQSLAGKQDTISDLATIRAGAAKGATALQSVAEATTTTAGLMSAADKTKLNSLSTTTVNSVNGKTGAVTGLVETATLTTELAKKQDVVTNWETTIGAASSTKKGLVLGKIQTDKISSDATLEEAVAAINTIIANLSTAGVFTSA